MTVYLPNSIGHSYTLGSTIYKIIDGKKVYGKVIEIYSYSYKNHKTHMKFKAKQLKK